MENAATLSTIKKALLAQSVRQEVSEVLACEPIAIIGLSCRLPGGVNSPEEFWDLMMRKGDATGDVPPDRWNVSSLYSSDHSARGKMYTRRGAFVQEPYRFDSKFFGMSPREVAQMDPQQRILLQVAWEALEDARLTPSDLSGGRTGVFIGNSGSEWGDWKSQSLEMIDAYTGTGAQSCVIANRLSYFLNLKGPSLTVDTACSSSLVAVHLACQSLRNRESNIVFVGGISFMKSPSIMVAFSKARILSPEGRSKAFDKSADGYGRGEGCGVLVMKRLVDAVASGDHIHAIIRASASNQDGRTNGISAPSGDAQEAVIRDALSAAMLDPSAVTYVEAHGTGTVVGDTIEYEALARTYGKSSAFAEPCLLGAVKANIGHLEAAAGVASIIKVVLSMKHGVVPGSCNFEEFPSSIQPKGSRLALPLEPRPWNVPNGARIAAVSAFGFGGTNAHVIIEEAPTLPARSASFPALGCLLPLSARDPQALRELASRYRDLARARAGEDEASLAAVCGASAVRRTHHPLRLAVHAKTFAELAEQLEAQLESSAPLAEARSSTSEKKLVMVFSGQGQQAFGMAQKLTRTSLVFKAKLDQCDEIFRHIAGWSINDELEADEGRCRLAETAIAQPVIFAVQVALASFWESFGIVPDAVVGHSVGEIAAAHVAGVLSLKDALRVAYERGKLMQAATGLGKMASVSLPVARVSAFMERHAIALSIGAVNDPESTVVSGSSEALERLIAVLEAEKVPCKYLPVDYAFHSAQMEPSGARLIELLEGLRPTRARCRIVSTVTGAPAISTDYDAAYWGRNVVQGVRFADAVKTLLDWGATTFLEIGGHPVLGVSLSSCVRAHGSSAVVVGSLRRGADDRESILLALGRIYTAGHSIHWFELYPESPYVRLPHYPFQDDTSDGGGSSALSYGGASGGTAAPSQVVQTLTANGERQAIWYVELSTESLYRCGEHRVRDLAVLPGAGYVDLALLAVSQLEKSAGSVVIEELAFERMLDLPAQGSRLLQVVVDFTGDEVTRFRVLSREGGPKPGAETWNIHATGGVRVERNAKVESLSEGLDVLRARCTETIGREEHYENMRREGLHYGPAYQTIAAIQRREGEVLVRIEPTEAVSDEAESTRLHPAILDGCFQAMSAAMPGYGTSADTYLPAGLGKLTFLQSPSAKPAWARVWLGEASEGEASADIELFDDEERLLVQVRAFRVKRVSRPKTALLDALYDVAWFAEPCPEVPAAAGGAHSRPWLIFADNRGFAPALTNLLAARGQKFQLVRRGTEFQIHSDGTIEINGRDKQAFGRLLSVCAERELSQWDTVVYLWGLDASTAEDDGLPELVGSELTAALYMVQSLIDASVKPRNRLWIVTQAAQPTGVTSISLVQAPLWGLGKTIALERPELHCSLVDVRDSGDVDALLKELHGQGSDDQVLLRGRTRYVARYDRVQEEDLGISRGQVELGEGARYRLEVDRPGVLDRLRLHEVEREAVGPGQVEVAVAAAGLNFLDVLSALGMIPADPTRGPELGAEVAGTVVSVDSAVTHLQPGQRVMAMVARGFGSHVVADGRLVLPIPDEMTFEEAATIPVAFATAWQALVHSARLQPGERVLIHAGAGGVGMAAIQIAQHIGAEVFTTVGSPEKRALMASLGIEHVMNSRSLDFADEILARTRGEGVDVIVNSLAGEFIPKGMSVLRPYGRFIELGKRDYFANRQVGLRPFLNSLTFSLVDLRAMMFDRVDQLRVLMTEVMDLCRQQKLRPLQHRVYSMMRAADAFRDMAQAKHVGKLVLRNDEPRPQAVPLGKLTLKQPGSYLITGGLGGLGLKVAEWLAQRGARHVVLLSRSKPGPAQSDVIRRIEDGGCQVTTLSADVSRKGDVSEVLARIRRDLPPLRGVVHAAGVLKDGMLDRQDAEALEKVLGPKVGAAWYLHEQTRELELDFFVLFSSAAALVGSPGQANYAAANAFLDALAHERHARSLPAVSINWGAWAEVGMAAAQANRGRRLESSGELSIAPDQGLATLEALMLQTDLAQVGVTPVDWTRWASVYPTEATKPLYSRCVSASSAGANGERLETLKSIEALPAAEREAAIRDYLTQELAAVMRLPKSRLDAHAPIKDLGVDSLMAVEFVNRVQAGLRQELPREELMGDGTVASLSAFLARKLGGSASGAKSTPPPASHHEIETETAVNAAE